MLKWMLVVSVLGQGPITTNLVFDSLQECLETESKVRGIYENEFNARVAAWQKEYKGLSEFKAEESDRNMKLNSSLLLENKMTCIPHE